MKNSLVLLILDGWGISKSIDGNAIALAKTPNWDYLLDSYPNTQLVASGSVVGLPVNQAGNSEVGHLHIGSGRTIKQSLVRINDAIIGGSFENIFRDRIAFDQIEILHVMILLSDGGVHSHQQHLYALLDLVQGYRQLKLSLHIVFDGRDTDPCSGVGYFADLINWIADKDNIVISSISGRYYAMDRDKRWDRTKLVYDVMTGNGATSCSLEQVMANFYQDDITDEFVLPMMIKGGKFVQAGDAFLCMNFRADRAHQIMQALGEVEFDFFARPVVLTTKLYSLTEYPYAPEHTQVIFNKEVVVETLGEVVANHGLQQLRLAETEKYAHVNFFLDGGKEVNLLGSQTKIIPSPQVKTYDLLPEMSSEVVTDELISALFCGRYDLIVVNFANADMVGHTGDLSATIAAVESLDSCLGKIMFVIKQLNLQMLITADHGNADEMGAVDQPITSHSSNPVPLVYYGNQDLSLQAGALIDVAPTALDLLQLEVPKIMQGKSLISYK